MRLLILALTIGVVCGQQRPCASFWQRCDQGEKCVATRRIFASLWLGECRPIVQGCTSDVECGRGECCDTQVKGRRKRQALGERGICKPLETASCGVPPNDPNEPKPCRSGSDCGPEECCDSTQQLRGRRKRQAGGILSENPEGVCRPLLDVGNECLVAIPPGRPAQTVLRCPCSSGMICRPNGQTIVPDGDTGNCARERTCRSGSDCGPNECCKSRVRPIGRKKRQSSMSGGTCEPLGTSDASCFTQNFGNPMSGMFSGSCPCEAGLTCQGTGQFDIPLGEIGNCRA